MIDKHTELQKIENQIKDARDKYLSDLEEKRSNLRDEIDNQKSSELIGKTFVYKDNSFGGGLRKDLWDVYLKVIGSFDGGIKVITVEKDSHGSIHIQKESRYHNNLMGYVPCTESQFKRNFKKLMKEINDTCGGKGE